MRWLIVFGCVCAACSRPNPAFGDGSTRGGSGSGSGSSSTGGGGSSGVVDGSTGPIPTSSVDASGGPLDDTGSSGSSGLVDEPVCDLPPSEGMVLATSPIAGGACPNSITAAVQITAVEGDEVTICSCDNGFCSGVQQYAMRANPLTLSDHVTQEKGVCIELETRMPLGGDGVWCYWGAMSLADPLSGTPFLIATTDSVSPTPYGEAMVGDEIPDPEPAGGCPCGAVSAVDPCCEDAAQPPEFFYYPFDDYDVFPGDIIFMDLPGPPVIDHVFEVFQAQRFPTCGGPVELFSWAVFALLP